MKKILSIFVLLLTCVSVYAQDDVTTFLGIPVDGFKPDMIRQLKAKGFVNSDFDTDVLQGEFNGQDVNVYIVTNNNKVYRIMLCDRNCLSEADIKNRFNVLCSQFEKNQRYTSFGSQAIALDEDISYEMLVNNKVYEAYFYQKLSDEATQKLEAEVYATIASLEAEYPQDKFEKMTPEEISSAMSPIYSIMIEALSKKTVWMRICEFEGQYYIAMYYDNAYNMSNGEDL